jgi:ribose transport system substrate-binding protein
MPSVYIPSYDTHVKFVHGHETTLLNAPYFKSKLSPIPIAYFLYKAISYKLHNEIKRIPGLTIASLEEYGNYSLVNLYSKMRPFLDNYENDLNFVGNLIDAVADYTKMPKDMCIKVNKNTTVTLNEVKKIYKNLNEDFLMFIQKKGRKIEDLQLKDLVEIDLTDLPWYMKNTQKDLKDIIIMGHTHLPNVEIDNDNMEYINTGFMCSSIPNLKRTPITYGIYDISKRTTNLLSASESFNPIKLESYKNLEIEESDPAKKPPFTFGWSVFNASLEFWQEMQAGVLSKAKELGINIITKDEKSSTVEMVTGSMDLIQRGVDALLIAPFDPNLLPEIVEEAKKNQIPVISIDIGTGGADVAAFIVSDSFGGGVFAGEYALVLIEKYKITSKNIAIIQVQKTAPYALLRGQGFKSVMVEKGYKVVAEISANSEEILGYEVMKNILATYKDDLAVVFCENGTMTLGAAKAIDEAGKKGIIMLIGFDSGPSIIEGIKNGSIQGTIGQQPFKMGQIGVETANSILLGEPVAFDDPAQHIILMEVYLVDESGEVKLNI